MASLVAFSVLAGLIRFISRDATQKSLHDRALNRHEVEILLKAAHSKTEMARLAGVSLCSVKRIAQESPVVRVDNAAERSQRQIGRPSTVANFLKQVVGILPKWGNCSPLKNLSFTWRLIMTPDFVLRYLVTHEAVHLAIPDHSQKFWLTVGSLCPESERARQWLCANGHSLPVDLTEVCAQ